MGGGGVFALGASADVSVGGDGCGLSYCDEFHQAGFGR